MSTSKEYKAVRNYILNELHLTKEDIIKNIEPLLEKHVKRYMVNTYGGDNQIENWIRCMVNDELKQRDHDFVRRACENVIRNHVLTMYRFIVFLPKKSTIGSKNPIMGILEENRTFISSRPGCILCRLDEMESWAYLDDLLP